MAEVAKEKAINMPDIGMDETAHTIIQHKGEDYILFVTIQHDSDCRNPLEDCDGMGHIYSMSDRHINHKSFEEVTEILRTNKDAVRLSYYEHSLCRWDVAGTATYPDAQWDSVPFAGVWVPDDALLKESKFEKLGRPGSPKRVAKMREWAQQACNVYTDWCNGQCYGYSIELYKAIRECDETEICDEIACYVHETAIAEDSCWGYIGDDVLRGAKEAVDSILSNLE